VEEDALLVRKMKEHITSWKRLSLLFPDKTPRDIQWRWSALTRTLAAAPLPDEPAVDERTVSQKNVPQKTVFARDNDSGALDFGEAFWFSVVDEESNTSDF
jgi:hypothetical protein